MRLLLDSHILIWVMREPRRVPPSIVAAIDDAANQKLVSAASVWETEIKRLSGRLRLSRHLAEMAVSSGFSELPVRFSHAVAASGLPPIHADPFDRMLVAQAQLEGLTLVTADREIARYDVPVLAA